jgi:hypothetical protein
VNAPATEIGFQFSVFAFCFLLFAFCFLLFNFELSAISFVLLSLRISIHAFEREQPAHA